MLFIEDPETLQDEIWSFVKTTGEDEFRTVIFFQFGNIMFPLFPPDDPYELMERVVEGSNPLSMVYASKIGFETFALTYPEVRTIEGKVPVESVLIQQYRDPSTTTTRVVGCSVMGICTADYIFTEKQIYPFIPEVGVSRFLREITSIN